MEHKNISLPEGWEQGLGFDIIDGVVCAKTNKLIDKNKSIKQQQESKMKKKKYYTIFITEESDYHCERMVETYEAEENLKSKDVFDLFLKERLDKTASWSASEGKTPNTNTSYVVEGIVSSNTPIETMSVINHHFDELVYDPSNRLGGVA